MNVRLPYGEGAVDAEIVEGEDPVQGSKGLGVAESWPSLLALVIFVLVVTGLAMARYRTTLD